MELLNVHRNVCIISLMSSQVVILQMQAGDAVVGASMTVAGAQSRSEDEESLGVKDVKRTATQAFGSGVPKRRSSSRFDIFSCMQDCQSNCILHFFVK